MAFPKSHVARFEADGCLWSEQRVEMPRAEAPKAAFIAQLIALFQCN